MQAFHLRTGKPLLLVFLTSLSGVIPAFAESALNFSRSPQELNSPNKAFVIKNKISQSGRDSTLLYVEKPDELFLISGDTKKNRKELLKYHRNVDVFWAPNSKAFIINDWKNNNRCDALLYNLTSLQKPISLKQKLLQSEISREERTLIANKDYSYVFLDKWQDSKKLCVKVSGHYFLANKTVAYTLHYLCDLRNNRWKLLKRDLSENLERNIPNLRKFGA